MARFAIRQSKVRDTAIVIVVQESNGNIYLSPKPGGERAKCGYKLAMIVVNLAGGTKVVDVQFPSVIGGTSAKYVFRVGAGGKKHKQITITDAAFAGKPPDVNLLIVPYRISVNGKIIDPDLEIER